MLRVLLLLIFLSASGCATIPMGIRHNMIVNGNAISYVETSGQAPTVVFESGLGNGLEVWSDVYDETRRFASVLAYSRPGYAAGFRAPRFGGQTTADDSAELLHELLAKSGASAPYILVGHSIGGLYVLEFARDYPELVAGLVLVDVRLPGFTEECEAADVGLCFPPTAAMLMSPPHIAAEMRGIRPSEAVAPSPSDIGGIPSILIATTRPPPGASSETQPIWISVQRGFADELADGRLVVAEGSGHYIQLDAPELVVDAIRQLVATIKSGGE